MLASELLGRAHVVARARQQRVAVAFAEEDPLVDVPHYPPHEAIEFFRTKVPLTSKTIERLVRMARERGQAVGEQLVTTLRDRMDTVLVEAMREGKGLRWFQNNLQEILARAGVGKANPFHVETIFRTNLTTAYTAGRIRQVEDDPAVAEVFQWWQFDATIDGATTEVCRAMHGKVYRRDSAVWNAYTPPLHYNCRSDLIPASREDLDAEQLTVSRAAPEEQPDVGFRTNNARALLRNPETGL